MNEVYEFIFSTNCRTSNLWNWYFLIAFEDLSRQDKHYTERWKKRKLTLSKLACILYLPSWSHSSLLYENVYALIMTIVIIFYRYIAVHSCKCKWVDRTIDNWPLTKTKIASMPVICRFKWAIFGPTLESFLGPGFPTVDHCAELAVVKPSKEEK